MKKLLPIGIAAVSVLSASAARAEEAEAGHLVAAWTCGKHVDVELLSNSADTQLRTTNLR